MMIVRKDLTNVPTTLSERKTETRRNTCIRDTTYHQNKKFDQRFKQRETKVRLKRNYYKKCAFCEQKVFDGVGTTLSDDTSTIEHYRPKSIYYWLAYSWDNLLWCCRRCNQNKDNHFRISSTKIEYNGIFLQNIHNSVMGYNSSEKPCMIHPELEDVKSELLFATNGHVKSDDVRVQYTITTCGIDRDDLNEKRKKILDELKKKINAKKSVNDSYDDILKDFVSDMKNKYNEFIAFRYWVLNNIQTLV